MQFSEEVVPQPRLTKNRKFLYIFNEKFEFFNLTDAANSEALRAAFRGDATSTRAFLAIKEISKVFVSNMCFSTYAV